RMVASALVLRADLIIAFTPLLIEGTMPLHLHDGWERGKRTKRAKFVRKSPHGQAFAVAVDVRMIMRFVEKCGPIKLGCAPKPFRIAR
ncbi:MAG: hypothetical protein AAGF68_09050, partial [Pseudomonadota bacterium]